MIGSNVKNFCCDDVSLIENYDKAVNDDKSPSWHCHHRLETHNSDGVKEIVRSQELMASNTIGEQKKMKKAENRYVIFDTYTGNMIMFVATEARAKKITDLYDTFDYYEKPKLFDQELLSNRKEKTK